MRAPRIPGGPRPPKHNQTNRQTRESRTRAKLLDKGKQNYFKYDMEDLLARSNVPEEFHMSLIQTLWAKGTRDGVDACKEYLKEKRAEGLIDDDAGKHILYTIDKYGTYR